MSANLLETLRITLFGMLGIFAVMIVIYLVIAVLNTVTKYGVGPLRAPSSNRRGFFAGRGWGLRTSSAA